jgi:hypothetical protein
MTLCAVAVVSSVTAPMAWSVRILALVTSSGLEPSSVAQARSEYPSSAEITKTKRSNVANLVTVGIRTSVFDFASAAGRAGNASPGKFGSRRITWKL